MSNYQKQKEALANYLKAHQELSKVFDNDTMEPFYPFSESFNEIKVADWVNSAQELINLLMSRQKWNKFISSRVLLPPKVVEQTYGFEVDGYPVYLYCEGFYISVTPNKEMPYLVNFENTSAKFEKLDEAEEFFFNKFVKYNM